MRGCQMSFSFNWVISVIQKHDSTHFMARCSKLKLLLKKKPKFFVNLFDVGFWFIPPQLQRVWTLGSWNSSSSSCWSRARSDRPSLSSMAWLNDPTGGSTIRSEVNKWHSDSCCQKQLGFVITRQQLGTEVLGHWANLLFCLWISPLLICNKAIINNHLRITGFSFDHSLCVYSGTFLQTTLMWSSALKTTWQRTWFTSSWPKDSTAYQ